MKLGNVVLSWIVSIVAASVISSFVIYGSPLAAFFIFFVSVLLSLPYLIIFALIANYLKNFWAVLAFHLVSVILTYILYVVFGLLRLQLSEGFYIFGIFFIVGSISHALFFYKDPLDGKTAHNEDVLDDML